MSRAQAYWASQDWSLTIPQLAATTGKAERTVREWRLKLQRQGLLADLSASTPFAPASSFTLPPAAPSFEASPTTQRSVRGPNIPTTNRRPPPVWVPREASDTIPAPSSVAWPHRILMIPDAHIPYHDKRAWCTVLAVAQVWRPTCMVILGDFLDLFCVSSHPKKPSVRLSLEDEICGGRDCLDQLDALGVPHKRYVFGNHENRMKRFIADKAPMFDGMLDVADLLGLERRGWDWTPYGDGIELGELYITHDLNIAGKYAVRRSMDAAWSSTVIGHTHRLEIVHQTDARGRPCVGASFGWLGDFSAIDYMKKKISTRQWRHGLGLCHMSVDGRADLQAIPLHQGRCRVEGNVITADDLQWSRAV